MQAVYERLKQQAEEFRAVDLEREVKEAFHLVYAVAQASAGDDGLFLDHTDGDLVQAFIDFTRDRDMLLILDLQNGHADLEAEVIGVLPYLSERHVHLALDPEFTMVSGELPGISIGSIDGEQINAVQRLLSDYVIENRLPNKILLVHQFLDEMVPNKQLVTNFPGVDVVFDMDGFGDSATKIFKYRRYAVEEPARYRGN